MERYGSFVEHRKQGSLDSFFEARSSWGLAGSGRHPNPLRGTAVGFRCREDADAEPGQEHREAAPVASERADPRERRVQGAGGGPAPSRPRRFPRHPSTTVTRPTIWSQFRYPVLCGLQR